MRLRSILTVCCTLASFLVGATGVFAADTFPFRDISTTDSIYPGLKRLYEQGIIAPPKDGLFHPSALMNRDEFVGIVVGVGCKRCVTPSAEDILKYQTLPFVDFAFKNPYFYCVSYAKEHEIVRGYVSTSGEPVSCQNGKTFSDTPFCAENNISRIEAAAVLLRQAGLWSEEQNAIRPIDRSSMELLDVDDYWYGYAKRAIENNLITLTDTKKIRPNEAITKREFVRMAEIIFNINLCKVRDESEAKDFSLKMLIVDKQNRCAENEARTTFPNTQETTYSFVGITNSGTGKNISYHWEFVNLNTKEVLTFDQKDACKFDLKTAGTWNVRLTATDADTGKQSVAYDQVVVTKPLNATDFSLGILITDKQNKCSEESSRTTFPNTQETIYSFVGLVDPISEDLTYHWEYINTETNEVITSDVKDDCKRNLKTPGVWKVRFTVTNKTTGKQTVAYDQVLVTTAGVKNTAMTLAAHANPLTTFVGFPVQFSETLVGGTGPFQYSWDFGDGSSSSEKTPTHAYKASGGYGVVLTVTDSTGKKAVAQLVEGVLSTQQGLNLTINADPIRTEVGLPVQFTSLVTGGRGPFEYQWNFDDGSYSSEENPKHPYATSGKYGVTLTVIDADGKRATARLVEEVTENSDIDRDGILDRNDACPLVFGIARLHGCPEVNPYKDQLTADNIGNRCIETRAVNAGGIFGKASCNSCPCAQVLAFNSTIRHCDILFPSILSPTKDSIYSRGELYEMQ